MCEMLAAAFDAPVSFREVHDRVATLEVYGLGSFGWGVAWLDDGQVRVVRGLGRFVDEAGGDSDLAAVRSTRFLCHLRRPNKLSTVQLADTQPFAEGTDFAFCHNGFLDRAEQFRATYADRLQGGADSEIGWALFAGRVLDGTDPADALREVDDTFGGKVNLGYLGSDGRLVIYSRNVANAMYTFGVAGGRMATTALHSDDDSVFRLVHHDAVDSRLVPSGTSVELSEAMADRT